MTADFDNLSGAELDAAVAEAMGLDFWVGEGGEVMIRRNRRTEMWYPHSDLNAVKKFERFMCYRHPTWMIGVIGPDKADPTWAADVWDQGELLAEATAPTEAIARSRAGLLAMLAAGEAKP